MTNEDWWQEMKCRDVDPEIFEGKITASGRVSDLGGVSWKVAREICGYCTVRAECLDYVLSINDDFQVDATFAAGLTPQEIARIRRKKKRR